jgi:hypothetical protein
VLTPPGCGPRVPQPQGFPSGFPRIPFLTPFRAHPRARYAGQDHPLLMHGMAEAEQPMVQAEAMA